MTMAGPNKFPSAPDEERRIPEDLTSQDDETPKQCLLTSNRSKGGPSMSLCDYLPEDLIVQILACVPRDRDPVMALVCKTFGKIVGSDNLSRVRKQKQVGSDVIFVGFIDFATIERKWFTLSRYQGNHHSIVSTVIPFPLGLPIRSITSAGPILFMVGASQRLPAAVYAYNSITKNLHTCPSMPVSILFKSASLIGNKLYVTGRELDASAPFRPNTRELQSHSFHIRSLLWEPAPSFVEPPFQDASCSLTKARLVGAGIDDVVFEYDLKEGLMWCSNRNHWKKVSGLRLNEAEAVVLAEYNGKLAILWTQTDDTEGKGKKLRLTIISLQKTETGIAVVADQNLILGDIPKDYQFRFCVSISG